MGREVILTSEEITAICKDIAAKLDDRFEKDNIKAPIVIGAERSSISPGPSRRATR